MSMLTLTVQKRTTVGKLVKKERAQGMLPAVFYGRKEKSTPISISYTDFLKVWKQAGESSVIALAYPGKENLTVLINDISFDPVRGEPIHADFYVVESDRVVEVSVPLEFKGTASAVKELGGTLVKVLHEIEVSGLPKDLPSLIFVDLTPLTTLESRILVKDLPVPPDVTVLSDKNEIVVLVSDAEKEEVEEKVFDATAIKVEKKGKKEEAGAEEEPASDGGRSSSGGKKEPEKKGAEKK